jgi:hypothetical protein
MRLSIFQLTGMNDSHLNIRVDGCIWWNVGMVLHTGWAVCSLSLRLKQSRWAYKVPGCKSKVAVLPWEPVSLSPFFLSCDQSGTLKCPSLPAPPWEPINPPTVSETGTQRASVSTRKIQTITLCFMLF